MKAHVSEKKKAEVKNLVELMRKYKTISLGDLTRLPSKQLQDIRHKLKKSLLIRTTKKRLIKLAITSLKEKDLSGFGKYLDKVMPVLLFSNEDSFSIYRKLKKNKVNVAAKPGQIAPYDLVVKEGPTSFPPGPIIGELGQVGIVAAVEGGKVTVKRDTVIAKEGEIIKPKVADILTKMGIEPMEVKLNLIVSYDGGDIYDKSVLDIDEEKILNDLKLAYNYSFNLAIKANYMCKETIKHLIGKASLEAGTLDSKLNLKVEGKKEEKPKEEGRKEQEVKQEPKEETKKEFFVEEKSKTEKSDEEVAEEVLLKIKDNDIKKKEEIKKEGKKEKIPTAFDLVEGKHKKEDDKKIKAEDLINK